MFGVAGWGKSHLDHEDALGRGWTAEYYITLDGRWVVEISFKNGGGLGSRLPAATPDLARVAVEWLFLHHYGFLPWSATYGDVDRIVRQRAPDKSEQDYALMIQEVLG